MEHPPEQTPDEQDQQAGDVPQEGESVEERPDNPEDGSSESGD